MGNIPKNLKFEDIPGYQWVLDRLSKRTTPKHLLLGNGFSMAYDHKIFSYNALYNFIEELDDPL